MIGPRYSVPFRRRRLGKTDFRCRRKLLLSGKSRFVVRKSLKHTWSQVVGVAEKGDKVIVCAHSKELSKYGWKGSFSNTSAAYLTGFLCGQRAKKASIKEAILDMGLLDKVKGSRVFACLKGFADAGIDIPFDDSVIPSDERIKGKHVISYFDSLSEDEKMKKFGSYLKNNVDVSKLPELFEITKNEIIKKKQ
ncbi:MAG: 50S ribosomal protein L18 [Candidatus Methanofastidiosia archaeon]